MCQVLIQTNLTDLSHLKLQWALSTCCMPKAFLFVQCVCVMSRKDRPQCPTENVVKKDSEPLNKKIFLQ